MPYQSPINLNRRGKRAVGFLLIASALGLGTTALEVGSNTTTASVKPKDPKATSARPHKSSKSVAGATEETTPTTSSTSTSTTVPRPLGIPAQMYVVQQIEKPDPNIDFVAHNVLSILSYGKRKVERLEIDPFLKPWHPVGEEQIEASTAALSQNEPEDSTNPILYDFLNSLPKEERLKKVFRILVVNMKDDFAVQPFSFSVDGKEPAVKGAIVNIGGCSRDEAQNLIILSKDIGQQASIGITGMFSANTLGQTAARYCAIPLSHDSVAS